MNEQLIPCGLAESRKSQIIKGKKKKKKRLNHSITPSNGHPMNAKQRETKKKRICVVMIFFVMIILFFFFFLLFCNPILNTSFEWVNERRKKPFLKYINYRTIKTQNYIEKHYLLWTIL
jgi:hypothetical protein